MWGICIFEWKLWNPRMATTFVLVYFHEDVGKSPPPLSPCVWDMGRSNPFCIRTSPIRAIFDVDGVSNCMLRWKRRTGVPCVISSRNTSNGSDVFESTLTSLHDRSMGSTNNRVVGEHVSLVKLTEYKKWWNETNWMPTSFNRLSCTLSIWKSTEKVAQRMCFRGVLNESAWQHV